MLSKNLTLHNRHLRLVLGVVTNTVLVSDPTNVSGGSKCHQRGRVCFTRFISQIKLLCELRSEFWQQICKSLWSNSRQSLNPCKNNQTWQPSEPV